MRTIPGMVVICPSDDIEAKAAVHAAMAGKGGMLIGDWNGRLTHIPMSALQGASRRVNPNGELWFSVRENTGQPQVMG